MFKLLIVRPLGSEFPEGLVQKLVDYDEIKVIWSKISIMESTGEALQFCAVKGDDAAFEEFRERLLKELSSYGVVLEYLDDYELIQTQDLRHRDKFIFLDGPGSVWRFRYYDVTALIWCDHREHPEHAIQSFEPERDVFVFRLTQEQCDFHKEQGHKNFIGNPQ